MPHRSLWLALAALALLPALALANDPVPQKAGNHAWDAGDGAKIRFPGVPGAAPMASASLPEVDASQLPGARVVLRKGLTRAASGPEHQGMAIYAVCVRAPGGNLPPSVEDTAFEKLNEQIQNEMKRNGARVDSFTAGQIVENNLLILQPFTGEAAPASARPGIKNRLQGKNFLGFVGSPPEILLCSFACNDTSTEASRACGPVIDGVTVEAPLVAQPRPGFFTRLGHGVVRHPLAAVGVLLGLVLMAVGALIGLTPGAKKTG